MANIAEGRAVGSREREIEEERAENWNERSPNGVFKPVGEAPVIIASLDQIVCRS